MSITVKDCLQLPSLSMGQVIAGHKGLDNIVNAVSVIEFDDGEDDEFYTSNELVISSLYSVRESVTEQCKVIEHSKASGDVGLVLFYSDVILNGIDRRLIDTANLVGLPIILLPGQDMGLCYGDVISEVMEAIFIDRNTNNSFVNNTIERISQLPESERNISNVLELACDYSKASFFLCDNLLNIISEASWLTIDKMDFNTIKSSFQNNTSQGISQITCTINGNPHTIYRQTFTDKKNSTLILFASTRFNKLNKQIVTEVVDIIQLFSTIWNYNLKLSTKEALIPAILDGDHEIIEYISSEFSFPIEELNTMLLFDFFSENQNASLNENYISSLKSIFEDTGTLNIIDALGQYVIVLCSLTSKSIRDEIIWGELYDFFKGENQARHLTTFCNLSSVEDIRSSYQLYCSNINNACIIYPRKRMFTSSEIEFAFRCQSIRVSADLESKKRFYNIIFPLLDSNDDDLLQTLATFLLDCDSEIKSTSELLFIHRNTTQYRLNKIKSLLGTDISKMPFAYDIYLAVALNRLQDSQKNNKK